MRYWCRCNELQNEGNITGYCLVGGIIGEKNYGSQDVINCTNSGKVSGSTWVDELYIDSYDFRNGTE